MKVDSHKCNACGKELTPAERLLSAIFGYKDDYCHSCCYDHTIHKQKEEVTDGQ